MLEKLAPAKINLTLEVLGCRCDGYHEILSVIQTIKLADKLEFEPADEFSFKSDNPLWKPGKSLAVKAALAFKEYTGVKQGANIYITKSIPFSAGLGGESSAAAAVLSGLNQLHKLKLTPGELHGLAARIGSDVPFFLSGGTAMLLGRGEKVSPLPPMPHHRVILLLPKEAHHIENKTRTLYAGLTSSDYTDGTITDEFASWLTLGKSSKPLRLFNVFEELAYKLFEGLPSCRKAFLESGAGSVHLAGSGPALFTLEAGRDKAEAIAGRLKSRGLNVILTETFNFVRYC